MEVGKQNLAQEPILQIQAGRRRRKSGEEVATVTLHYL